MRFDETTSMIAMANGQYLAHVSVVTAMLTCALYHNTFRTAVYASFRS